MTAPIIGPRTADQLDAAFRALDLELDEQALGRIDEIFPGYRTAPEHCATLRSTRRLCGGSGPPAEPDPPHSR